MSKPTDNPADAFKKALAEASKVMANDPELNVSYSVDPSGLSGDSMRLPQVSRRMTRDEVLIARGTADAFALRHKFHDAAVSAKYMPQGQMAQDLYSAMENARVEAVGARHMPGTAGHRRGIPDPPPRDGSRYAQRRVQRHGTVARLY